MISPIFSNTNKKFNIIILAAGKGERLKPATEYIAKPLIKLGDERAIDYIIKKYQHIAHKFIIAIGYEADLLQNYVQGKYSSFNIEFSREDVGDLHGPGHSLLYALDHADSKYPTIITFCDYIINDVFSVDNNALCVCDPNSNSVLGTYRTYIDVEEGVAIDICNNDEEKQKHGFTGLAICHDTLFLKYMTYYLGVRGLSTEEETYEAILREYIQENKTSVIVLKELYDFGETRTLEKTRRVIDGNTE